MSARRTLLLGTRGSELARTQSTTVAEALRALGCEVELAIIRTSGDRAANMPFGSIGPQGVFVREIEEALVARTVDLAVHSFKDLPTQSPAELVVAAVPARADPADVLLVRADALVGGGDWLPVKPGAQIGTASARRRVWLGHYRKDLRIAPLRGNVPTRIRKLVEGELDAIVLAAAGIARLQVDDRLGVLLADLTTVRLDPQRFVPAPAQGALAVQCRRADAYVLAALAALDDTPSRIAVDAERDALARAEGGCDIAFGAYCTATDGVYELVAMHQRAGEIRNARVRGRDPAALAAQLWPDFAGAANTHGTEVQR